MTISSIEFNITDPQRSRVTGSVDAIFDGGHISGAFESFLCDDASDDAGLSTPACTP